MHQDIAVEDQTYQTFWRQVLRWLVTDAPGQVSVNLSADQVGPNEPVTVDVEVTDKAFHKVNSANVVATITTPSEQVIDIPLEWSVTRDGQYHVSYTPTEMGVHRIEVTAHTAKDTLTSEPTFIEVATPIGGVFRGRTAALALAPGRRGDGRTVLHAGDGLGPRAGF